MSRAGAVVVRRADPAEFALVGRLTVQAYRDAGQLTAANGYEEELADVATRAGDGEVLVAVNEDGRIIGSVTFALAGSPLAELAGPGEAEFRMLAVEPGWQGRGAGEALVRACLRRGAELGVTAIAIYVRDFSHGALRLYARLGFVRLPERDWNPMDGVCLLALRLDLSPEVTAEFSGGRGAELAATQVAGDQA